MNITRTLLMGLTIFTCASQVQAAATATYAGEGSLDKDLIRRVVRAHIPEIRHCYNQALSRNPEAQGEVVLDFTIGVDGKVTAATVAANSMGDAMAAECMRAAATGWLFPKPDGGYVVVTYPFVLEPG